MSANKIDARQSRLTAAQAMIGSASGDTLDTVFPKINDELAKLFEDRNVMLQNGGIIIFTGTQIQFTENLEIVLNQKISGAAPQVISLGSANVNLNNGDMWYAVINRTAGTATTAVASTLPAVTSANQEVFLLVKRVDAGDGTQRIYWRSGMAMDAGQSNRLGASGTGGGSGTGDDLGSLLYRASFQDNFDEGPSDSKSAVNIAAGFTDSTTYSAAKKMYVLNYDASKTIAAATTTTTINLSAVAAYTVKIGDVVVANGQARRITAVGSQSSFTTAAFTSAPTLGSQVTVSQAVHTKDIYNLAVDGNALSAAFAGATFQDVLIDTEDTTTVGDSIFDVNVASVVAYDAGNDGSTFTDVKVRPTLEMTQMSSILLPSAGTGLYVRLYAFKTSGSGSVNVLRYKAFMQKSTVSQAGGIVNTAYAFTNSVGTPINCSVGVSGGKTTLTLTWQYAMSVLSGTTASSIEVWLNGAKLPRFVDSTLTPDGSFIETSSSIITLDRDYSSQNLSVEVFQRTAVLDASTQNTSNISYLQEINQNGFQSFVAQNTLISATTTTGSPVAGSFYSSIVNRAAIVDISQNLKVSMGLERIMTQSFYQISNEFGPNGETVSGVVNDTFNQVRLVGNYNVGNDINGSYLGMSASLTDYMEITFYGTGLNVLTINNLTRDLRASVDGGAEGSNIVTSGSAVLQGRNYASNIVFVAASGLTLGIHTVKIRNNNANGTAIYGFEVLNQASSLNINSGVSYVNGTKLVSLTAATSAYNSSFDTGSLGTRGGRVVAYQKNDGTIGKAVQSAGSQQTLTSADHSNEEVVRVYNWREFGAGRTDDFSLFSSGAGTNLAFTLDDGTTTLTGSQVSLATNAVALSISANGSYTVIQFIGTGLDIIQQDHANGGADTYNFQIDGGSTIALPTSGSTIKRTTKLVSGLTYGAHSVRINRVTAATWNLGIHGFIVYQPKKPSVPTNAFELADYNVLANYSVNATAPSGTTLLGAVSQGVIRKMNSREIIYTGTYSPALDVANFNSGFTPNGNTSGNTWSYTFFGTGIDVRHTISGGTTTLNTTVTLDGSTNFTGLTVTTAFSGSVTFTASTGLLSGTTAGTTSAGNLFSVSGLTLGLHTIKFTTNNTQNIIADTFDIITPIHSVKSNVNYDQQNTLPVGSCALSDNRKTTPIKDINLQKKNVSQAVGIASNPTTTSTVATPAPDMSVIHTNASGKIKVNYNTAVLQSTQGALVYMIIYIDGSAASTEKYYQAYAASANGVISDTAYLNVSPGPHKIDVYWRVSANTGTLSNRNMIVEEV